MRRFLAGALFAAGLFPGTLGSGVACASEMPRAALVVDTGSAVTRYCVALDGDGVTGIDLIVLAAEQHGLSYRLGYGGRAVCMLEGVGTDGESCLEGQSEFWGYWGGDGSGGWAWSSTGAATTPVRPGDVQGWAWGAGTDGSTHPAPPPTTFEDACPAPEAEARGRAPRRPAETPSPDVPPAPAPAADDVARAESGDSEREVRPGKRPRANRIAAPKAPRNRSAGARSQRELVATSPPPDEPDDSGLPPAGAGALALAASLASAGILIRRRRPRARGPG